MLIRRALDSSVILTAVVLLLAGQDKPAPPAPPAPPMALEVTVDGKAYHAFAGKPFTVTTPKGEKLKVTVRPRETQLYSRFGITFAHHHSLRLTATDNAGVPMITADGPESVLLMVQKFGPAITTDTLIDSYRTEYENRDAIFADRRGRRVEKKLGGTVRKGKALDFELAGQKMTLELFTFPKGDATIAVILQWDHEDAKLAKKHFKIVTDSIR